jgi:hypothetical protein
VAFKVGLRSSLQQREAAMATYKHPQVFLPLDLEIMDRVYEAAWAELEARDPFRDRERDGEREETLRKLVMDQTGTGKVDFDTLFEKVVANFPERRVFFVKPRSSTSAGSSGSPEVGA